MPSKSYGEFRKNLTDVTRLLALHKLLSVAGPGKRKLGHLTRGGVVLLCAAWERYVESVLEEGAEFLAGKHTLATLPLATKAIVNDHINGIPTTPRATFLADLPATTRQAVAAKTAALNTPKHKHLKDLFNKVLGVPDIGTWWMQGTTKIDDFVKRRGDVAHRGSQAAYVRVGALFNAVIVVGTYVAETDNALATYLKARVTPRKLPWNRV